jgi:hypothetical protein
MSAIVDELVTRLARGEPMEVAERERLKRALGESPRLCETFEVQQSLSDCLRGLSRELRCLRAPDALDALLAKVDFPAPERTAGRSARATGWAVAATAAAIVVLIGLVDSAGNLASRYGAPTITFAPRATSTHDVDDISTSSNFCNRVLFQPNWIEKTPDVSSEIPGQIAHFVPAIQTTNRQ